VLAAPDALAANSSYSARGLERAIGRPVQVIYPPVRTDFFTPAERPRPHYLVVSRLRPHKRIDVVIEAFRRIGEPLVIAGEGLWRDRFERDAPPNVSFAGHVGDEELRELYRTSRALISASVEEFGLCLAEALACGTPVVAPRAGGSGEIVADGVNGVALDSVDPDSVVRAVERLDAAPPDPAECRRSAERFSVERFEAELAELIDA
jgi:glycosyltransferase involved in cell wall biosynthesis